MTSGGGPTITGAAAGPPLTGLDPHDAHPAGPPNPAPYPGPGPIPVVTHDGPHPFQQLANGRQQQHPDDNWLTAATRHDSNTERRGIGVYLSWHG